MAMHCGKMKPISIELRWNTVASYLVLFASPPGYEIS